jgi:hypothetical protein
MNVSKGKSALGLGLISLMLSLASASSALAQSWKISNGRSVGALLPTENRKLADGSAYLTGGSRVLVETEDPLVAVISFLHKQRVLGI